MKRVALLRSNPKDFGYGKLLTALSRQYGVDCFLWDRQGDYVPPVDSIGIRYMKCSIKGGFYDLYTFLKMLAFNIWLLGKLLPAKADYIHAIDLDTGVVGLLVSKIKRRPFVYQCLDPYYAILPAGWPRFLGKCSKWLENFVISRADLFIVTDTLRMAQHSGAKPKSVLEFSNVPPLSLPKSQERDTEHFVVGYIGSLIEGRNLLGLVETAGGLREHGIRLIIGGFGPLEEEIRKRTKQYENVSYVGWVPYSDVLRLEQSFDLFVYTTDPGSESQRWVSPAKLFESMALGRPIIVSRDTLAAERVSRIGNGIAVEYGSASELREAILSLRNDGELVQRLGTAGQGEYQRAWTYEIMEKRLLDAYREIGFPS